jgi:hypothetical protein
VKICLLCDLRDAPEGLRNAAKREHELLLIAILQYRIEVLRTKLRIFTKAFNESLFMISVWLVLYLLGHRRCW